MPIPEWTRNYRSGPIMAAITQDGLEYISPLTYPRLRNVDGFTVDLHDIIQHDNDLAETAERTRAGVEDHREGYCRVHPSEPREVIQEAPVEDPAEARIDRTPPYLRAILTDNSLVDLADLAARRNSNSLDLSDNLTSISTHTDDDPYCNLFREEWLKYIKTLLRSGAAIRYSIEVK